MKIKAATIRLRLFYVALYVYLRVGNSCIAVFLVILFKEGIHLLC